MGLFDCCCCCFSLRTGAVILGWLGIAAYLFECGISVITFINIDTIIKNSTIPENMIVDDFKIRMEIFIGCMLLLGLLNLIAAALLIVGAASGNRFLLVPWIIGGATQIIFQIVVNATKIAIMHAYSLTHISFIVYLLIEIYLWLCVVSLFLRNESDGSGSSTGLLYRKQTRSYSTNYYRTI